MLGGLNQRWPRWTPCQAKGKAKQGSSLCGPLSSGAHRENPEAIPCGFIKGNGSATLLPRENPEVIPCGSIKGGSVTLLPHVNPEVISCGSIREMEADWQ